MRAAQNPSADSSRSRRTRSPRPSAQCHEFGFLFSLWRTGRHSGGFLATPRHKHPAIRVTEHCESPGTIRMPSPYGYRPRSGGAVDVSLGALSKGQP
jgi:hypothetical protein